MQGGTFFKTQLKRAACARFHQEKKHTVAIMAANQHVTKSWEGGIDIIIN